MISAWMKAPLEMTPLFSRPAMPLLRRQSREQFLHPHRRPLQSLVNQWTRPVLHRPRHLKEICPTTAKITIPTATTKRPGRLLLFLARFPSPLLPFLRERQSRSRKTARMTCTRHRLPESQWTVRLPHRLRTPSSSLQCLPCHLCRQRRSRTLHLALRQGNP